MDDPDFKAGSVALIYYTYRSDGWSSNKVFTVEGSDSMQVYVIEAETQTPWKLDGGIVPPCNVKAKFRLRKPL